MNLFLPSLCFFQVHIKVNTASKFDFVHHIRMIGCFQNGSIEFALCCHRRARGHGIDRVTLQFQIFQALLFHGGHVGQKWQSVGAKHTQWNEFASCNEGGDFTVKSRDQLNLP